MLPESTSGFQVLQEMPVEDHRPQHQELTKSMLLFVKVRRRTIDQLCEMSGISWNSMAML